MKSIECDVIGQGPPDNERINEDIGSDRISQEPLSLSLYLYLSIYLHQDRTRQPRNIVPANCRSLGIHERINCINKLFLTDGKSIANGMKSVVS